MFISDGKIDSIINYLSTGSIVSKLGYWWNNADVSNIHIHSSNYKALFNKQLEFYDIKGRKASKFRSIFFKRIK